MSVRRISHLTGINRKSKKKLKDKVDKRSVLFSLIPRLTGTSKGKDNKDTEPSPVLLLFLVIQLQAPLLEVLLWLGIAYIVQLKVSQHCLDHGEEASMKKATVWRLCTVIGALLQMVDWWIVDIWILGIVGGVGFVIGIFRLAIYNLEEASDMQSNNTVSAKGKKRQGTIRQATESHPETPPAEEP